MKNKFANTGDYGYNVKRKMLIIYSGLKFAVLNDFSVTYKIVVSITVLIAATIFHRYIDVLLLLLSTGLVLVTELVNSAIEALCDFVEERHNEKIKVIKDIAAAAAGIAIVVWIVVFTVEVFEIWGLLF